MLNIALSSSRAPIFSPSLLGPLILIPTLSITLLAVILVMQPPHINESVVVRDEYDFPTVMHKYCQLNDQERNDFVNTPVYQVLFLGHVSILITLLRMAWSAKNENIAFNEARGIYYSICVEAIVVGLFVFFSMLIHSFSDLLGVALIDLIMLSYLIPAFTICTSNIIFIVLPKFYSSQTNKMSPKVPEVVNPESRIVSNVSVLTKNSVDFVEQSPSTDRAEYGE